MLLQRKIFIRCGSKVEPALSDMFALHIATADLNYHLTLQVVTSLHIAPMLMDTKILSTIKSTKILCKESNENGDDYVRRTVRKNNLEGRTVDNKILNCSVKNILKPF